MWAVPPRILSEPESWSPGDAGKEVKRAALVVLSPSFSDWAR